MKNVRVLTGVQTTFLKIMHKVVINTLLRIFSTSFAQQMCQSWNYVTVHFPI